MRGAGLVLRWSPAVGTGAVRLVDVVHTGEPHAEGGAEAGWRYAAIPAEPHAHPIKIKCIGEIKAVVPQPEVLQRHMPVAS